MEVLHLLLSITSSLPLVLVGASLVVFWALDRGWLAGFRFETPPPREAPLWQGVDVLLVVFLYLPSAVAAYSLAEGLGKHLSAGPKILLMQVLWNGVSCGLVFFLVMRHHGQPPASLGLSRSSLRNVAPVLVLLFVSYVPLGVIHVLWIVTLKVVGGSFPAEQQPVTEFVKMVAEGNPWDVGCLVFGAAVVAPVAEEILFRGFLFGTARVRWGFGVSLVATSVAFALVHGSIGAFVPLFCVGALLCYIYERTGSIYYSILFHSLFNTASLTRLFDTASPAQ